VEGYILPGFIDAHVHIESSMVTPVEFSRLALRHGTIGAVSDPHEIANVMGNEGVKFMVENGKHTPMKIIFGAPSCVPATSFESSGAQIGVEDIHELLQISDIRFLSEMMNYPGVIQRDKEVVAKIEVAKQHGVPIDGHAPGLRGEDLLAYTSAGISTDHECFSIEEAKEKIERGMKILIREGSGAKNFHTLIPLLHSYPEKVMFCTDDLHPDDLMEGHINLLVREAIKLGYNLFDVIKAASYNAKDHYRMNIGMLREGDPADFIMIDSLEKWNILRTVIKGIPVYDGVSVNLPGILNDHPNNFNISPLTKDELEIPAEAKHIRIIEAINGELITRQFTDVAKIRKGKVVSDIQKDILKIVVINRYKQSQPGIGFIKGFGIKKGAIASSIAHDSHNIICVGVDDQEMLETVNWVIAHKGGIAINDGSTIQGLPLEIAGIMSSGSLEKAAAKYNELTRKAKKLGSEMNAPFMTLAFMALLVIPELKLSDKGLFDGNHFKYTSLFVKDS
jgi:adenine deaminase